MTLPHGMHTVCTGESSRLAQPTDHVPATHRSDLPTTPTKKTSPWQYSYKSNNLSPLSPRSKSNIINALSLRNKSNITSAQTSPLQHSQTNPWQISTKRKPNIIKPLQHSPRSKSIIPSTQTHPWEQRSKSVPRGGKELSVTIAAGHSPPEARRTKSAGVRPYGNRKKGWTVGVSAMREVMYQPQSVEGSRPARDFAQADGRGAMEGSYKQGRDAPPHRLPSATGRGSNRGRLRVKKRKEVYADRR